MADLSPLWLHVPDEDRLHREDVELIRELRPAGLLVLRFARWPTDKGGAATVCELVRELGHPRLLVRMQDEAIAGKDPRQWAHQCADALNLYANLRSDGVMVEVIPGNELNLADPEGGHTDWGRHADWLARVADEWQWLNSVPLHVPAPARMPCEHDPDWNVCNQSLDYWRAIRDSGAADGYARGDVHAYRQDYHRAQDEYRSVWGDRLPYDVTECCGEGVISAAAADARATGGTRVIFIANWVGGGQFRQSGHPAETWPQSIAKHPHLQAEWLATLAEPLQPVPAEPEQPAPAPMGPVPEEPAMATTYFTTAQIAAATQCPAGNITSQWPLVCRFLERDGINDRPTQIAAIATIAIETASTFLPVREAFWLSEEWRAANLRYYPFYGRGLIQLTWRENYQAYGDELGVPLVDMPDEALNPEVSAAVLARYFLRRGVADAARRGDWESVRRRVQGGTAGLDRLLTIVSALEGTTAPEPAPIPVPSPTYVFPVQGYSGAIELHWGTYPGAADLFAPAGTPVVAFHSGAALSVGFDPQYGGNNVLILGDDGLTSYYAHGDRWPAVVPGARVEAGAFLFGVGDTGNAKAAGPHLHFGLGYRIESGSGPRGGAGADNFDAVGLLRQVLDGQPPLSEPENPCAGLIGALAYVGDDVSRALEEARAALTIPPLKKRMLKKDWEERARQLEALIHEHYRRDGEIKDELVRVRREFVGEPPAA